MEQIPGCPSVCGDLQPDTAAIGRVIVALPVVEGQGRTAGAAQVDGPAGPLARDGYIRGAYFQRIGCAVGLDRAGPGPVTLAQFLPIAEPVCRAVIATIGIGNGEFVPYRADGADIEGTARRPAGPVPGVETDAIGDRAAPARVRGEADPGGAVGGQQTGRIGGYRAERGPAVAVEAVLPLAVGIVHGDDGDAFQGAAVRVGDAVAAGTGDELGDGIAGVGVLIDTDGIQVWGAAVVQQRRVVDRIDGDGEGVAVTPVQVAGEIGDLIGRQGTLVDAGLVHLAVEEKAYPSITAQVAVPAQIGDGVRELALGGLGAIDIEGHGLAGVVEGQRQVVPAGAADRLVGYDLSVVDPIMVDGSDVAGRIRIIHPQNQLIVDGEDVAVGVLRVHPGRERDARWLAELAADLEILAIGPGEIQHLTPAGVDGHAGVAAWRGRVGAGGTAVVARFGGIIEPVVPEQIHLGIQTGRGQVPGDDRQRGAAGGVGGGDKGRPVQGGIDIGQGTGEDHGGITVAVPPGEAQTGGLAQGQTAVSNRKGHFIGAARIVRVADGDRVAVGAAEHQGGVLVGGLVTGQGVDGRLVDVVQVDGDISRAVGPVVVDGGDAEVECRRGREIQRGAVGHADLTSDGVDGEGAVCVAGGDGVVQGIAGVGVRGIDSADAGACRTALVQGEHGGRHRGCVVAYHQAEGVQVFVATVQAHVGPLEQQGGGGGAVAGAGDQGGVLHRQGNDVVLGDREGIAAGGPRILRAQQEGAGGQGDPADAGLRLHQVDAVGHLVVTDRGVCALDEPRNGAAGGAGPHLGGLEQPDVLVLGRAGAGKQKVPC